LLAIGPKLQAAEVTFGWDAVADSRVQVYEVHYGLESGMYDGEITSTTTRATVPNLTPGKTYYVAVRACGAGGTPCSAFSNEITTTIPPAAPTADFSASPTSGAAPLDVTFADASTGALTSMQWDFGDGATSTDVAPSHTYKTAGDFTATLTVTGPGGVVTKSTIITVAAQPPVAGFTASPSTGLAPLPVTFEDSSTGEITSRQWRFGDGGSSAEQSPSHTYLTPGTYTVTLTVNGPGGSGVKTASVGVTTPPPKAAFSASIPSEASPLELAFTDTSSGTITSWGWTFGDGATTSAESPGHVYPVPGTYRVSLTVTGPGGTDTATKEFLVGKDAPIEVGEVTVNQQWKRVNFQGTFVDPVVVAGAMSGKGGDPAVVRVAGIDASGFWVRVQEWDYLDGRHRNEVVPYLVAERGSHQLPDGSWIEAGTVNTDATDAFVSVPFTAPFAADPVVLASVTTDKEDDAVTTRLRQIDVLGFEVGMQQQESNPQVHAEEAIDYVAWQPSSGVVNGLRFEVKRTGDLVTDKPYTLNYPAPFAVPSYLLLTMQSTDGGDTANLRWKSRGTKSVQVWVDEEQSRDRETKHTSETVGHFLLAPAY
jgi:PKD repeat protein